jgi:endonuclease/exonuclease/phosphatase family metal-dependent hydrolase
VILVGDLNDQPGSPMYEVLTQSGYADTWRALRPGVQGLTCCHVADLSDQVAGFDQRIDYIFTRGLVRDDGKLLGQVDRFGEVPADRVAGPAHRVWPSDHAGLIAALR